MPTSCFGEREVPTSCAVQSNGIHHKRMEMGRWFCRSITGLTAAFGGKLFNLNPGENQEHYAFSVRVKIKTSLLGEAIVALKFNEQTLADPYTEWYERRAPFVPNAIGSSWGRLLD